MVLSIFDLSMLRLSGQRQTLCLLLASNGSVLGSDPLEGAQVLLGGMCNGGAGMGSIS